jgi:hypothetical protein
MKHAVVPLLAVLLAGLGCGGGGDEDLLVRHHVALSPVMQIDRIYKSMAGPTRVAPFVFKQGPPELLWITGYRTEVVAADGESPVSQEFLCHNNLDFDWARREALFGGTKEGRFGRMFTTSQGQFGIALPEGFGIPVVSNEPLRLGTQVLNHNIPNPDIGVRHKITIDYVRDEDARGRLRPVFPVYAFVMALLEGEDGYYGLDEPSDVQQGASCLPGGHAPQAGDEAVFGDRQGRRFSGHWVVPPGREVRRTLVTRMLDLPFDSTIHYIAVHLHPFAESLELRDLTTGETLFRSEARGPASGVGLAEVDHFSSAEGIPIRRDHEYEMVSVYDNTSGEDQDAMASFFLYLHDVEAERSLDALRQRIAAQAAARGA